MENFLLKLLNMSLTGSYVILAVLILRLLLRGAPRWVSYALWAVPFLRLALPFSFESTFSLVRVKPNAIPADIVYAAQPMIDSGVLPLDAVVNSALTVTAPDVTTGNSVNPLQVLLFVCFWLWLAGVICLAVSGLIQTIRLHRYLRTARHIEANLYEIGRADTPFVFGFLKPRIYLPAGLHAEEYEYILAHEQHHIKRFDHILRPLAYCVTVAHWFNPLVWLAYWLLGADMEQSCDEAVLRRFGAEIRKTYSASLVGLASAPRALRTGPLGFAENDIARRVKRILHWKRPAVWFTVLAACAAVVVGCGLMSDPVDTGEPPLSTPVHSEAPERAHPDPAADYAFMYMSQVETLLSQYFEVSHRGYGIQEHAVFDDLLDETLTVYQLDVYFIPEDYEAAREALNKTPIEATFVKNGEQYELVDWIDGGWTLGGDEYVITDASNYCHIYFTILPDGSVIQFDRLHYDSESSSKEYLKSLLRTQLEIRGLLKPPTFKSAHYVVTYEEYHPGVMKKLLLSQPAKQGEGGIWFVERMMDENGYEHISAAQNYTALQKDCNDGHNPWMLDPEQVALEFIRRAYDSARIVEIKEGTYEDFQAWPISTYTGYIIGIDLETNHLKLKPTVSDKNGKPVLWAKSYPTYYDYLPFYEELTVMTINGTKTNDFGLEYEFMDALKDGESGLYATCTYYAGYIQKIGVVRENATFRVTYD